MKGGWVQVPSYLYSQVNSRPDSFVSISPRSLVMPPSIGRSGMCIARPQRSRSSSVTPISSRVGTKSF